MSDRLAEMILPHVDHDPLAARMSTFYAEVDAAVSARNPACRNRGLCCQFDRFGHRLYVTTVELAYFVRGSREQWRAATDEDRCPYHIAGRCTARQQRPLGCRIFFCEPAAKAWQGPEYERRLTELKDIGAAFSVAYRYTDWLSALRTLGAAPQPESGSQDEIDAGAGSMID